MNYGGNRFFRKKAPEKIGFKSIPNIHKSIVLWIFISFLPIVVIGLLAYYGSREIFIKNVTKGSLDLLAQTVANIQLKLTEFEHISVEFFIDDEFKNIVTGYLRAKDSRVKLQAKNDIESYFNKYMTNNPDIFAFMFTSNHLSRDTVFLCKNGNEEIYDMARRFRNTTTYKNIYRASGGIVWSSSIKINANHYLILGRVIKNTLTGENLGVLSIVINEERVDRLANLNIYNKFNMPSGVIENFNVIINDKGEIVSTVFKKDIGKTINEIMTHKGPLEKNLSLSLNQGYQTIAGEGSFITSVNGKETLVTFKSIGSKNGINNYNGWFLLSLTPTSYLYSELKGLYVIMIIVGLFLELLCLWFFFYCIMLPGFFDQTNIPAKVMI